MIEIIRELLSRGAGGGFEVVVPVWWKKNGSYDVFKVDLADYPTASHLWLIQPDLTDKPYVQVLIQLPYLETTRKITLTVSPSWDVDEERYFTLDAEIKVTTQMDPTFTTWQHFRPIDGVDDYRTLTLPIQGTYDLVVHDGLWELPNGINPNKF